MTKTKKVIFRGLGPTGNIVYNGKLIEDGAIVDLEEKVADAYIKTRLACEVMNEGDALTKQKQVYLNKEKREKIIRESLKNEEKKKKEGAK